MTLSLASLFLSFLSNHGYSPKILFFILFEHTLSYFFFIFSLCFFSLYHYFFSSFSSFSRTLFTSPKEDMWERSEREWDNERMTHLRVPRDSSAMLLACANNTQGRCCPSSFSSPSSPLSPLSHISPSPTLQYIPSQPLALICDLLTFIYAIYSWTHRLLFFGFLSFSLCVFLFLIFPLTLSFLSFPIFFLSLFFLFLYYLSFFSAKSLTSSVQNMYESQLLSLKQCTMFSLTHSMNTHFSFFSFPIVHWMHLFVL